MKYTFGWQITFKSCKLKGKQFKISNKNLVPDGHDGNHFQGIQLPFKGTSCENWNLNRELQESICGFTICIQVGCPINILRDTF